MDGDGDVDVLSASYIDNTITRYENSGSEVFTNHTISSTAVRAWSVFAIDMDGDGDVDVLSAYSNRIGWFENMRPTVPSGQPTGQPTTHPTVSTMPSSCPSANS